MSFLSTFFDIFCKTVFPADTIIVICRLQTYYTPCIHTCIFVYFIVRSGRIKCCTELKKGPVLTIFDKFWKILTNFDKFWQILTKFLTNFDKFWQILTNFLTKIVDKNLKSPWSLEETLPKYTCAHCVHHFLQGGSK